MTLWRIVVAIEYIGQEEDGVVTWARIREKLPPCGVKVIEPPTVVQEIARHEPEKEEGPCQQSR